MNNSSADSVTQNVKNFILQEFLPGEDPNLLQDTTPLITGGILDSIGTLKLVSYLEEQFSITLEAHEADSEFLNTLNDITALVQRKRGTA